MPGGDGTGPAGMGPMTGRAAGFCAGYPVPGFMNPIPGGFGGRGFGWGRGRGGWGRGFGRGRGRWFGGAPVYGAPYAAPYGAYGAPYAAPTYGAPFGVPYAQPNPQQETDALKGQAEYLEDALEGIRKRLAELEAEQAEKK
jgi:hypothetical protein